MIYENLTDLQKIALKGQVARVLLASTHEAELKVNVYRMLFECDKKYRNLFFEAIKEAVTLDEEVLNRIYFEVVNKSVPIDLWIDCVMEDIKWMMNPYSSLVITSRTPIDKTKEKQNLLKSMFIRFIRELLLVSPEAIEMLLNKIQENDKFEFLHSSCIYLKDCCDQIKNSKYYAPDNITSDLFKYSINMVEPLSLGEETAKIAETPKPVRKTRKSKANSNWKVKEEVTQPKGIIQITKIDLGGHIHGSEINEEELPNFPTEELQRLIDYLIPIKNVTHEKVTYVVQKAFKNTGITTDIKQCDSEEEAEEFVEEMSKQCPETCELIICKKIIEE